MDSRLMACIGLAIVAVLSTALIVAQRWYNAMPGKYLGAERDRGEGQSGPQMAETVLLDREKRVDRFQVRRLGGDEREVFATEWRNLQARFVDDPQGCLKDADALLRRLMQTLGFPLGDFEHRIADISATHPRLVDSYQAAHQVALRQQQGAAMTEDLRSAILHYRSLFHELLHTGTIGLKPEVA